MPLNKKSPPSSPDCPTSQLDCLLHTVLLGAAALLAVAALLRGAFVALDLLVVQH